MSFPDTIRVSDSRVNVAQENKLRTAQHEFRVVRTQFFAHCNYLLAPEDENRLYLSESLCTQIRAVRDDVDQALADLNVISGANCEEASVDLLEECTILLQKNLQKVNLISCQNQDRYTLFTK